MERPAFDRLITATLPQIQLAAKKYAMRYRRFYEWEDIAQTALLKMLRFADLYDPDKGDFLPCAGFSLTLGYDNRTDRPTASVLRQIRGTGTPHCGVAGRLYRNIRHTCKAVVPPMGFRNKDRWATVGAVQERIVRYPKYR